MAQVEKRISLEEFTGNVESFFERVVHEQTTVVVENEKGERIRVQPDHSRHPSAPVPEKVRPGKRHARHPADRLAALQARIQAHRSGQILTNIDDLLEENRQERDAEISDLH